MALLLHQKSKSLWDLGYRMTSAEIEIENPLIPGLSCTFLWQDIDQAPHFPVLRSYLGSGPIKVLAQEVNC